ncbi:MAG: hypothetical protein JSR37_01860 [Verrucomicrobia bacterium]|nr:hypothetical protein [Verrucomicrobiota bacterium]MBS0635976.1 hypothetical protein [Verrucomicrobiota bacterium]
MIASHVNYVPTYAKGEMSLFLKSSSAKSRNVKESSKIGLNSQKPIDEILYIEGTVSVAF